MRRTLSSALVLIGVALLVMGVIESDSIGSSFSRLFTGEPTDKAIWLLISGGLVTIVGTGAFGLGRDSK